MKNSRFAFNLLDRDNHSPFGYKYITCRLIFDVRMESTIKARYVDGGHLTNPTSSITYAGVVIFDSVSLAFLVAAFNYLDILAGEIQNSYLNAPGK